MSWYKLVSTRRSIVLSLPLQLVFHAPAREYYTSLKAPFTWTVALTIFVMSDWFCQAVCPILPGSLTNFEIGIFLSLHPILCNVMFVCRMLTKIGLMASQNWVGQQQLDQFWLFHVNDPLLLICRQHRSACGCHLLLPVITSVHDHRTETDYDGLLSTPLCW